MKYLKLLAKVLLPVGVVAICAVLARDLIKDREPPTRRQRPEPVTRVEVIDAKATAYRVIARSQGTVQPRTESTLIPEIAGRVVTIAPNFRAGEFFEAGDVLATIDPREYQAAVTIAQAELTQAQARLSEELARAAQAEREWRRLAEKGEPDALVLRKPQVASARAAVSSAQARLVQRKLDLERTRIIAPYAGRVLEKRVDVGQYVSAGNALAKIYAVDYVEIRLPLSDAQLQFVEVPEIYRSGDAGTRASGPPVVLSAQIGNVRRAWRGRLVRAEGAIDTKTRQLYVIAQVDDPYAGSAAGGYPLKIGQFVQAEIQGRQLEGVFVIPRGSLRAGSTLLLVDDEQRLQNRPVTVVWSDETHAVVIDGLRPGDRIVTTALSEGVTGTPVRIAGEQRRAAQPKAGRQATDTQSGRPDERAGNHRGKNAS